MSERASRTFLPSKKDDSRVAGIISVMFYINDKSVLLDSREITTRDQRACEPGETGFPFSLYHRQTALGNRLPFYPSTSNASSFGESYGIHSLPYTCVPRCNATRRNATRDTAYGGMLLWPVSSIQDPVLPWEASSSLSLNRILGRSTWKPLR